jgi:hypothetical protein
VQICFLGYFHEDVSAHVHTTLAPHACCVLATARECERAWEHKTAGVQRFAEKIGEERGNMRMRHGIRPSVAAILLSCGYPFPCMRAQSVPTAQANGSACTALPMQILSCVQTHALSFLRLSTTTGTSECTVVAWGAEEWESRREKVWIYTVMPPLRSNTFAVVFAICWSDTSAHLEITWMWVRIHDCYGQSNYAFFPSACEWQLRFRYILVQPFTSIRLHLFCVCMGYLEVWTILRWHEKLELRRRWGICGR